jgi:hypothetical protein
VQRYATRGSETSLGWVTPAGRQTPRPPLRPASRLPSSRNLLSVMNGKEPRAVYDGYGSCPLTVEKGRIVFAEFGYGGKLLPTLAAFDPSWSYGGPRGYLRSGRSALPGAGSNAPDPAVPGHLAVTRMQTFAPVRR